MITEAQKNLLTPEQLSIAEKWEKDALGFEQAFQELDTAYQSNDQTGVDAAMDKLDQLSPDICEHNQSVLCCNECDAIENILHPELFHADGFRLQTDCFGSEPPISEI